MKHEQGSSGLFCQLLGWRFLWFLAGFMIASRAWSASVPEPPTNLTAVSGSTSVRVTLYPPNNNGGAAITSYTVTANPGSGTCSPPIPTGPTTSCTVTGLTSGTTYSFTATATNSVGTSNASDPVSATPDITVPGKPTNMTSVRGNGAVGVQFFAPTDDGGASITSYTVTATPGNHMCSPPLVGLGKQTNCTVSGLTNGTQYTFTATASNSKGTSDNANSIQQTPSDNIPSAPSGVSAIASNAQAIITWNAVNWNNNTHIDNYTVTAYPGNQQCVASAPTATTQPATTCTVSNLVNGTSYTFKVVTNVGALASLPSEPSNQITPSSEVPATPTNVLATSGNATVTVTWDAQSPQPTGYEVQAWSVSPQPGGGFTTPVSTGISCVPSPATNPTCTFPTGKLTVGLWYEFTVTAQNSDGISVPSTYSNAVQPYGLVTFNLQDLTQLSNNYQIYVTGFSTAGPYMLTADGSFSKFPHATGTLSCFRYPQDISKITIDSRQNNISARVYYFVVSNTGTYTTPCEPGDGQSGLFAQPDSFTYTDNGAKVSTPDPSVVLSGLMPAWTFSEIGTSSTNATIDLSQVDFFSFPMNTQAQVTSGPEIIGNPIGEDNPAAVVNATAIYENYRKYFNTLAEKANGGQSCVQDSSPIACAFLDLLQPINNAPGSPYVIQNPGGYLGMVNQAGSQVNSSSPLNTLFDGLITNIWSGSYRPLTLDSGGYLGGTDSANGVSEDVFVSSQIKMNYPGSSYPVDALKFVGNTTNYVAYVFDPTAVSTGCKSGKITSAICGDALSGGYQVFAGAGVLRSPSCEEYNSLLAAGISGTAVSNCNNLPTPPPVDLANYQAVAGRLGFLISTALNRGVGNISCTGDTWTCWQDETKWYPTDSTSQYTSNTLVQNLFSRWIHTAAISGTPIFVQPPSAVKSAGGKTMGMAYGFSNDENPTPPIDSTNPQPEVPSKFDSTVLFGVTTNTITFGPWTSSSSAPQLTVNVTGQGTVTSSPAGIACGTSCLSSFTQGETVQLTAQPLAGYVFSGWTGGCSGSGTTCMVTMSSSKMVQATFVAYAPGQFALNVTVAGKGTVSGGGINCQPACSVAETANSVIKLTAAPVAGASFTGWSGACSGTSLNCQVTMSQPQSVHASFKTDKQSTLTISSPVVGGTVTTQPAGINCGKVCVAPFENNQEVTVIAQPSAGYVFAGWTGACTGTQSCDLTMNGNQTLTAKFAATPPQTYSLTVHDMGSGTVISNPAGIQCGSNCSSVFTADSQVTLTPTPSAGFRFSSWGGACSGSGACVVDMESEESVTATFVSSTPTTSSISGSVSMPGTSGSVTLALIPGAQNSGKPSQTVLQTVTSGPYTFSGLNNGEYTLSIVGLSKQKLLCTFAANQSLTAPPIIIADADSTGNTVNCLAATKGYSVGGLVSGLDPGKAVSLRNNGGISQGGSTLSVNNPGPQQFLFANQVANTSGYAVTIKTQPPGQTCVVAQNGTGTVGSHGKSLAVGVSCQKKSTAFSIGGSVTGLPNGQTVVLLDNGSDTLPVNGVGDGQPGVAFIFASEISNGNTYSVSIQTQPAGYHCSVLNGSGIVNGSDVTNVEVACKDDPATYQISGTVYGLQNGQTVSVQEGSSQPQVLTPMSTTYSFNGLLSGSAYSLSESSAMADCSFDGPNPASGIIRSNVEVNLTCVTPPTMPMLSVQNSGPTNVFLLNRSQAAVVQLNGGQTATVWGGASGPTTIDPFVKGFEYNVHSIGQSKGEDCDQFDDNTDPGTLVKDTTIAFMCTNVGAGAYPGECAGLYNNNNDQPMPASPGSLCARGMTSGAVQLTDGRWQWRCSGSGNPKVLNTPAGPQWQGTATCYSASYNKPDPGKKNQAPLWISPSSWSISAGGSQTFTVEGGSGTGDLYVPGVESVGHAICSVQTRVNNSGYRIVATKAPNTKGNGACVVWAKKMGDTTYYDVAASPTIINVTGQ